MPELYYNKVLFLSCPTGAYCREDRCQSFFDFQLIPTMRPPLEECEAGGALIALGCEYKVIDAPALKIKDSEFMQKVISYNADLIIFAVTFGSIDQDLDWAKKLRTILPDTDFGLRGAPCYINPEKILRENNFINFAIQGDYEIVFDELAKFGFRDARGSVYINSDNKIQFNEKPYSSDLDILPFADRSGIDPSLYTVRGLKKPQATIRVQRGCPFPCTYCLVHTVNGDKARHRSPENIAAEMRKLIDEGTKHFYLRAETFSLDRNWTLSLCRELSDKCPEAKWVTTTRVECVDMEVLTAMKAAGCYGISFGLDVVSKEIAKRVKKPPQIKRAAETMRICDSLNILTLTYFMIGFVWETTETLKETAKAIKQIKPDLITIHYAHPYPGTVYYNDVAAAGLRTISNKAQAEPAISMQLLSAEKLKKFARSVLIRHYFSFRVISSVVRKIFAAKFAVKKTGNKPEVNFSDPLPENRNAA